MLKKKLPGPKVEMCEFDGISLDGIDFHVTNTLS